MDREKLEKLALAFNEAGLRLLSVRERVDTSLWSEDNPRVRFTSDPLASDTPKQETEVTTHVSFCAELL